MIEHYPKYVYDMREEIKIFAVWDGIGSSVLDMQKVQRELEELTFDPSMMKLCWGFAEVKPKPKADGVYGVIFAYIPRGLMSTEAILKMARTN